MTQEKIESIKTEINSDIQVSKELVEFASAIVRDCSEMIRKNPMYTSFYQNPDTMADSLLKAYGIERYNKGN